MEGGGSEQGDFGSIDAREVREADRRDGSGFDRFLKWLLTGYAPEPAPAIRKPIEKPKAGRVGICCSGGGVRSAAYNLGVLQHLRARGVLQSAHYLSAVSGGSYIAAAMTLARRSTDEPFAAGSPEEQYLRNRTTYLVPHGNEAVFLGFRMLLGLAINLLLFALAIGIPALVVGLILRADDFTGLEGSRTPPEWAVAAVAGFGIASLLFAVGYLVAKFSGETARRTVQVWTVRLLLVAAGLAFAFLLVPELVAALRGLSDGSASSKPAQDAVSGAVPAASLATILLGLIATLRATPRKELTEQAGKLAKAVRKATPKLKQALVQVAGAVAVPLLALAWIVLVVNWVVSKPDAVPALYALGGALALLLVLYLGGNLTSWSLHPFYRSRLASAFALERTPDGEQARALDPYAIPTMADAQPGEAKWPKLLVCAAANISDVGATPHGRRVTAFTFGPDQFGGPLVGYVETDTYEGHVTHARSDVMTAVAVSGAALSPSMGKLTRRSARALLTLANVRLGVWLPNPRDLPRGTAAEVGRSQPSRPRPTFLLREMLGMNSVRGRYLYVTDGGHYENLGLVELLRRGCTHVYCFDAGSGDTLGAFGEAIALARSELGVEIENVDVTPLAPNKKGISESDCLTADIRYSDGTTGKLLYARQLLTGDVPYDVLEHAAEDPRFPHDPIVDQFFTDQRFEAYRAIGEVAGRRALAKLAPL